MADRADGKFAGADILRDRWRHRVAGLRVADERDGLHAVAVSEAEPICGPGFMFARPAGRGSGGGNAAAWFPPREGGPGTTQTSKDRHHMQLGVFIPIGNNGWLISTTSPQYKPSFDLNRTIVEKAERFGFDFALSMIKLHGFGGPSRFWDYNLESFTLMAGLAAVTSRIQLFATCAVLTMPPPIAARMAVTIDSHLARPLRGEHHLRLAAARIHPDGHLARRRALPPPLRLLRRIRHDHARAVGRPAARTSRATSSRWTTAAACRCRPRRSRSSAPRRATPARAIAAQLRRLQFLRQRRRQPADRGGPERGPPGDGDGGRPDATAARWSCR